MMKKQILLFVLALLPLVASAEAVEIDGIWYNLVSKIKEAEVTSKPSEGYKGSVVIPEKVSYEGSEYSVTSIGDGAFQYCIKLTSVTIPNSVISIGNRAFGECSGLTSITIPNSVTSIGEYAFYYCLGLSTITIPNSVTSIGNYTFQYCSGLISVTIPNSVTSIGDWAFYLCKGLTSITIPNSVIRIGEKAFYGCSRLTSMTIPNSVISIGGEAFGGCSGLTKVSIPNNVSIIGRGAFAACNGLKSVHISDLAAWCRITFYENASNPLYYAHHLFLDGEEITDLVIPNSVTSIGDWAFYLCRGLTSITIPNSVTSIGRSAFSGCRGLTSIAIPNSVTSIGIQAFSDCSGLTTISIGKGVQYIAYQVFANCPELTDVYCYAEKIPNNTYTNAFEGSYIEYATLHVPADLVNAYRQTAPWSGFKNIVALEGDMPETQKCATPTIGYSKGKLTFHSETEGVEYKYEITDADIRQGLGNEVQLAVTYNISVFAMKQGYDNSDVATATLCWVEREPVVNTSVAQIPAQAVLITSEGGMLTVEGADDGTQVSIYGLNGTVAGEAVSRNGSVRISTTLQPGSVAIVKIGQKSVKVVVK